MTRLLVAVIRGYGYLISPFTPPSCRFFPTCSDYAEEALRQHGALKGTWLALRRIARCHPLHPGGHDPVPKPHRSAASPCESEDGPRDP